MGGKNIFEDLSWLVRWNQLICAFMNILVENCDTLEYLTEGGQWTKNPRDGKSFPATTAAVRAAKGEAIAKFNIVYHIPATNQFINLDHGRGRGLPEGGGE
jgi:hypothetical protein